MKLYEFYQVIFTNEVKDKQDTHTHTLLNGFGSKEKKQVNPSC